MSDLVTRLRDRAYSGKAPDALCEEAAAEIERLRSQPCPYVTGTVTQHCTLTPFTLTDEERVAIERAISTLDAFEDAPIAADADQRAIVTLRSLLERTK